MLNDCTASFCSPATFLHDVEDTALRCMKEPWEEDGRLKAHLCSKLNMPKIWRQNPSFSLDFCLTSGGLQNHWSSTTASHEGAVLRLGGALKTFDGPTE